MDDKKKILGIAKNLKKLGNCGSDGFNSKQHKIKAFLINTKFYIQSLDSADFSKSFDTLFKRFKKDFTKLEKEGQEGPSDSTKWSEKMMSWSDILKNKAKDSK